MEPLKRDDSKEKGVPKGMGVVSFLSLTVPPSTTAVFSQTNTGLFGHDSTGGSVDASRARTEICSGSEDCDDEVEELKRFGVLIGRVYENRDIALVC